MVSVDVLKTYFIVKTHTISAILKLNYFRNILSLVGAARSLGVDSGMVLLKFKLEFLLTKTKAD